MEMGMEMGMGGMRGRRWARDGNGDLGDRSTNKSKSKNKNKKGRQEHTPPGQRVHGHGDQTGPEKTKDNAQLAAKRAGRVSWVDGHFEEEQVYSVSRAKCNGSCDDLEGGIIMRRVGRPRGEIRGKRL